MTDTAGPDEALLKFETIITECREKLAAQPGGLFPAYADALVNLSSRHAELGNLDEALAAAKEAVGHFRQLYGADAAAHGVGLASGLNNLANRLSDVGRDDEGREIADEAFMLARGAMDSHPEQARFVQVSVLMNQSGRSWRAGQSLRAIEELGTAVETFRDGGEAMVNFLGVMVDVLHRNAMSLSESARWEEAVALRRMTVKLFPPEAIPAPVVHLLALTLQQSAFAASRDGRPGEALPLVEEAADLARDLAHGIPEQYDLFLAQSLGNLASRQHEAHADQEALESALEAINAFQTAAKHDASAAVLPLAATLETFAAILITLGHTEQAQSALAQREQLLSAVKPVGDSEE